MRSAGVSTANAWFANTRPRKSRDKNCGGKRHMSTSTNNKTLQTCSYFVFNYTEPILECSAAAHSAMRSDAAAAAYSIHTYARRCDVVSVRATSFCVESETFVGRALRCGAGMHLPVYICSMCFGVGVVFVYVSLPLARTHAPTHIHTQHQRTAYRFWHSDSNYSPCKRHAALDAFVNSRIVAFTHRHYILCSCF